MHSNKIRYSHYYSNDLTGIQIRGGIIITIPPLMCIQIRGGIVIIIHTIFILFIYIGTTIQVVESRVQQTYDSSRESKPWAGLCVHDPASHIFTDANNSGLVRFVQ